MEIEFLSKFNKDLLKINDKSIHEKVIEIIEEIENSLKIGDIKNISKLSGYKTSFRIKTGDYRIGLYFENGKIILARILHRKDIYKLFP